VGGVYVIPEGAGLCQARVLRPAGPGGCRRRAPAGLGQGGGDQGAGQPGQQHRGAGVQADVGDPDLDGRVARGQPGQEVDAPRVQRRPLPDQAADRRVVGGGVRPVRGRGRGRPAGLEHIPPAGPSGIVPAGDRGVGGDGQQRRQPGPQPGQHLDTQVPGGDPDVHVAGAGAGLGHHRAVPAGQLAVPGLGCHGGQPGRAVRRDPRGHQPAAQPRRGGRSEPPEPDQLAAGLVQAGAHPGSGLHLEPHQLLPHPRLPAEHPHQLGSGQHSGASGRVQQHELLLHPQRDRAGRAHRPRRAAGGGRGPSRTARSGHHSDHLLLRGRAQRQPLAQRAGQAGHGARPRGAAATAARPA